MALTGVHVTYGVVQPIGGSDNVFAPVWSETMAAEGTTTQSANAAKGEREVFCVQPAVDVFVAIGLAPDASVSPRSLVQSGDKVLIPCSRGDKLAWRAA